MQKREKQRRTQGWRNPRWASSDSAVDVFSDCWTNLKSNHPGCFVKKKFWKKKIFFFQMKSFFREVLTFIFFGGEKKNKFARACPMLQYSNFFHLALWNHIYSNSTTKGEKMCEKLLCCFMLPVGTIALAGISTWQNPLISPHKTTSCIPQGYYSNWVSLISLYVVLLPLQSRIIYSAQLCIPAILSAARMCVRNARLLFVPTCCTLTFKPSEQRDLMFCFVFLTPPHSPQHRLNQVVGGFPPTRCLFAHPSVCLWII